MKLEYLNEFVELVRSRGFNRAAKRLFMSQSSLSAHIKSLEKDLGFKLVERDTASFALTPAGSLFLSYAQSVGETLEKAREECSALSKMRPSIRVSGPISDFELHGALSAIDGFRISYVDLPLHLTPLDMLAADEIDVGVMPDIAYDPDLVERAESSGIAWRPIKPGRIGIAVSKSSALAQREALKRGDLIGAAIALGSPVWFDLGKNMYKSLLGDDLSLKFVLTHAAGEADLSCMDLGETIHICEFGSIRKRYANRDDIVVFDTLDGTPLLQPRVLVYSKHPSKSHVGEYVDAVAEMLPR